MTAVLKRAKRAIEATGLETAQHPFAGLLGPLYSSDGMMHVLGTSTRRALAGRRRRWTVLAAQTREGTWVYPVFQADVEHARVHGWLVPLLRQLRGAPRWGAALWLVTEHPELDGQSPLKAAEAGFVDPILAARLAGQYRDCHLPPR